MFFINYLLTVISSRWSYEAGGKERFEIHGYSERIVGVRGGSREWERWRKITQCDDS